MKKPLTRIELAESDPDFCLLAPAIGAITAATTTILLDDMITGTISGLLSGLVIFFLQEWRHKKRLEVAIASEKKAALERERHARIDSVVTRFLENTEDIEPIDIPVLGFKLLVKSGALLLQSNDELSEVREAIRANDQPDPAGEWAIDEDLLEFLAFYKKLGCPTEMHGILLALVEFRANSEERS